MKAKETGMNISDAAAYLGCSEYTIRRMARNKEIKHYRVGTRIMFRQSILDKFILSQENESIFG